MKPIEAQRTDELTKEAWHDNWDRISIDTIMEIFGYPRVKKLMRTITENLPDGGRLVEAGCGLGPWMIQLGRMGYDVTGVDYQEECIRKIKEYDPCQKVYTADIRQIPVDDGSFDAYLSFGVIEHFAEGPEEALREANRVLKTGGRMVLSVPYMNLFLRLKAPVNRLKRSSFIRRLLGKQDKVYYYQRYFKVKELEDIVRGHGFTVEKTIPVDHIFSLVEFSDIFREKGSYDGENRMAVALGNFLEKTMPWMSAGSTMIIATKDRSIGRESKG